MQGIFWVLLTAILSGFSIWLNKIGASGINPYVFTTLKNTIVALTLCFFLARSKKTLKQLGKKQWLKLIIVGLVGGSLPFLLFFKGLSITTATNASFIHKTMFAYVGILSLFLQKEKIDKNRIISSLLLLFGLLLYTRTDIFSLGKGDLFVLLATILWATEITLSKHLLKKIPSSIVTWSRMFFGSLFLSAFLFATNQASLVLKLGSKQWAWVIITSMLLLGYVTTFYKGLKKLKALDACVILLLSPVITALLSTLAGGEFQTSPTIGILFIIAGLATTLKNHWNKNPDSC